MGTGTTQDRPDNSRRAGDPPLGREQTSEGDGRLTTGDRLGHGAAIRGKPAPRSVTRAERAIGTAPNPGTSRGGALGAIGRPEERSHGERTGPKRRRAPRRPAREPLCVG